MGNIGTAYGCIFAYVGGQAHPDFRSRTLQNKEAVRALPEGDEYPELTRNMFSITATSYPGPGLYKYQVVHFGLSMKDAHEEWDLWMRKFERLLGRMAWNEAELHLTLEPRKEQQQARFDFRWEVPPEASPSQPEQWLRTGELPYSGSRERCREWVPEAELELGERPEDPELMQRLLYAYQRTHQDEKARALWEALRRLDPERARTIELI